MRGCMKPIITSDHLNYTTPASGYFPSRSLLAAADCVSRCADSIFSAAPAAAPLASARSRGRRAERRYIDVISNRLLLAVVLFGNRRLATLILLLAIVICLALAMTLAAAAA